MTDVFISYSRKDRKRVQPIALALAAEGFAVWWDPAIKPGRQWNATIRKALDNSACVLTCWSKTSVKSDWVLAETTQAYNRHKLVPVLIQGAEPPLPYNMLQCSDLSDWKGDAHDGEWGEALREVRRLVEAKRRLVAAAPPPGEAHAEALSPSPSELAAVESPPTEMAEPANDESDSGEFEPYEAAGGRGPRWGRMALGAGVATIVLTAGLYGAPYAVEAVKDVRSRLSPAPVQQAAVAPPAAPIVEPKPDIPNFTPDGEMNMATIPANAVPAEAPTPVELAALPAMDAPVSGRFQPPHPGATGEAAEPVLDELETCLNQLVRMCVDVDPALARGFAVDSKISVGERRLLSAAMFPDPAQITTRNLVACQANVGNGAPRLSSRREISPLAAACGGIADRPHDPQDSAAAEPTPPPIVRPRVPRRPPSRPLDRTSDATASAEPSPVFPSIALPGAAITDGGGMSGAHGDRAPVRVAPTLDRRTGQSLMRDRASTPSDEIR